MNMSDQEMDVLISDLLPHYIRPSLLTTTAMIRFRCGCELEVKSPVHSMSMNPDDFFKRCRQHNGSVISWFNNKAELEVRDINVQCYYSGENFNGGHFGHDHGDWSIPLWKRIKAIWKKDQKT